MLKALPFTFSLSHWFLGPLIIHLSLFILLSEVFIAWPPSHAAAMKEPLQQEAEASLPATALVTFEYAVTFSAACEDVSYPGHGLIIVLCKGRIRATA